MTHKFVWLALTGVLAATSLSGCGFQLRGYHNTERLKMVRSLPATQLVFGNAPEDVAVKNALKHQFALMTLLVDGPTLTNNSAALVDTKRSTNDSSSNIQMQTYRLRGLLTEIRMVMSAEVTYRFNKMARQKSLKTRFRCNVAISMTKLTLQLITHRLSKLKCGYMTISPNVSLNSI